MTAAPAAGTGPSRARAPGVSGRLAERIVALRAGIFARVNGEDTLTVPGERVGVEHFRRLYADPAANGRSRGAALSDLFWYWLAPGPEVHQEHLEPGPRYEDAARCTRRILVRPKDESAELTRRCVAGVLDGLDVGDGRVVRLRDEAMPIWAELYHRLVFGEPCPPGARELIVGHADDVISALKCVRPRNMRRRARLTRYLRRRLADVQHPLPDSLTAEEQAYYLQGTFFNTAIVQMSEATAHLLLAIAQHPDVQRRLVDDPEDDAYLDTVVDESLRTFPLFGIAHRISTADIELPGLTVPAGTVLCFSYPDFHRAGYDHPDRFDPDRWEGHPDRSAVNFLPFGVTQNRACPARGLAPLTLRVVAREVLRRYDLASTAAHTRSLPNRGPVLLTPRGLPRRRHVLRRLAVRDRWEDVGRSVAQLGFGTWMVLDARRRRLCARYFAGDRS